MRSMYADLDRLDELGLPLSHTALAIVQSATACDACGTTSAPSDPAALAMWFVTEAPKLGNAWRIARPGGWKPAEAEPPLRAGAPPIPREYAERSRRSPAIGIPDCLLVPMLDRLDREEREFLRSDFVIAICDVCRHCEHAERETRESIMDRYEGVVARVGAVRTGTARRAMALSIALKIADEIRARAS